MKPISRSSGFTLTELMVVLMIVAILTSIAAPSFIKLIEKRRLIGAGEQIFSQMVYARNEALKRSRGLVISFDADGSTSWAYGISDRLNGSANPEGCDPTVTAAATAASCSIDFDNNLTDQTDRVLYRFSSEDYSGVSMSIEDNTFSTDNMASNVCIVADLDDGETCFDPVRGVARQGTVQLTTTHFALNIELGILGRARLCTPTTNAAKIIPDYPEC